jgi:hypothetical protein
MILSPSAWPTLAIQGYICHKPENHNLNSHNDDSLKTIVWERLCLYERGGGGGTVASVCKRTKPTESYPHSTTKLVKNFSDRGCHVVSVTNPYGCILGFLDRSHYHFFQVAPQLYLRGWVDPVPDPLLFFKCPGIEPGTSVSVARNSDH